jgi:predicted acylesterase/phospholipase RssA
MNTHIDPGDIGRRFCDLVLKGGITSGVVYPAAVARLSRQYRFRNIGGTSAGAIAAAAAAAAEFRRATDTADPEYGFRELEQLTEFLGARPTGRHSRLFDLFRPERNTRKYFAILGAMLNRDRAVVRVLRGVLATMGSFPVATVIGALPGAVVFAAVEGKSPLHMIASAIAVVTVLIGAVGAAAATASVSLARALPRQDFGLARGHFRGQRQAGEPPALTDWLHAYLQQLSGKDATHALTFGDLDGVTLDESKSIKGINLQMMTTALSMGRPFSLPFDNEQFYFKRSELELFFASDVVAWMSVNPGPRSRENLARDEAMAGFGFLPFPHRATLPVVVAVRMSLSFPILLSAIPLYRYAWEGSATQAREDLVEEPDRSAGTSSALSDQAGEAEAAKAPRFVRSNVRRVLFSDGGICSNFPVQMFDSVLPGWPTFGINLRDDLVDEDHANARAYLPERGKSLPPEDYGIELRGFSAMASFAAAIVKTMQNWRDNLQRAAPGFRDRIVTVRHTTNEGGLNLDMPARTLEALAASGALAARELVDAFARPQTLHDDHLIYHRWVRIRSLLSVLQDVLQEIHEGVTVLENHPPYPELIRDAPGYVGDSYRLSQRARDAAARLLDDLDCLDHELDQAELDYSRTAPRPAVELRIQPVL